MIVLPGYKILSSIYQGPTSELYRAVDLKRQKLVVIKTIAQNKIDKNEQAKLINEYNILSQLDSPFVVKCLELITLEDNNVAIILEDDQAVDLSQSGSKTGLTLEGFLKIAIDLVKGLDDIHRANVVHCDIKPSNIIIHPESKRIKYIDFGSASLLRQETRVPISLHQAEGSLFYISPEQTGRINRPVDYRTDFYSLGVTFYELLCGQLPFQESSPAALIHHHIAHQARAPHLIKPEIPEVLSNIVLKLMAKNAEERYQSCYGILKDLERCLTAFTHNEKVMFALGEDDFSEKFQIPQKLYGRNEEIECLLKKFDSACNGPSEVVMVTGYSGIGKSFLVNEVQPSLALKNGSFVAGKFDQLSKNIAYSAIIEILHSLAQQILTEPEENLVVWKEKLLSVLEQNGQLIIDLVPEIEIVIGKQPALQILEPAQAKNRFNVVLTNFLNLFAYKEHPLVVFLDDLQWADLSSLELFEFFIKSQTLQYTLFIGSYRSNEINSAHPVQILLNSLLEFGIENTTIELGPLSLQEVNQWVSEALHSSREQTQVLSECVFKKTAGNPFFIKLFLQSLYESKLISLTSEGKWQWDLALILQHPASDNVIQLMNYQLQFLPKETQKLLALASCFGKSFTVEDIALVTRTHSGESVQDLVLALNSGILLQFDKQFMFAHDRVQEAVYALLGEEEKKQAHLLIGNTLLALYKDDNIPQQALYSIVNHLNASESLIFGQAERYKVARYNLLAGQKAKAAGAYAAALTYLQFCQTFFQGYNIWSEDIAFSVTFYKELAEVEYLNGHFEQSEAIIRLTQPKLPSNIDKADLYNILIVQKTMQGEYQAALTVGEEALSILKINLPLRDPGDFIQTESISIKAMLVGRSVESLLYAPEMENPEYRAAMKILLNLFIVGYMSGSELLPVVVLSMTRLSIEHGHVTESCMAYAAYGMLLCTANQEYTLGNDFAALSIKLSEKFESLSQKCRSYNLIVNCIHNWTHPIHEVNPLVHNGYNAGIASGELQYAGYLCQYKARILFDQGMELGSLRAELDALFHFGKETKNQIVIDLVLSVMLIRQNLVGETSGDLEFQVKDIDDAQYQKLCTAQGSFSALVLYYIMKAQVLYLYGFNDLAFESIKQAEPLLSFIPGQYALANYNWYYSLILLALYPQASEEVKSDYLKKIENNQIQMQQWSSFCEANFSHKYFLVAAELARVKNQPYQAQKLYSKALKGCRAQNLIQEQALICELAAKFWLTEEDTGNCVQGFLNEAYRCYKDWGARRKAEKLRLTYQGLLAPISSYKGFYDSNNTISWESLKFLDLATLLKASQTISQEVDLSNLLVTILETAIVTSGAQAGTLVLYSKGELRVQADYNQDKQVKILGDIPLEQWHSGAASIIKFVSRSQKPLILDNATEDGAFTQDSHIKQYKTKSILCLPIFKKNEFKGLLYLENNVSKYAFSKQHIDILNVLATQMIISIQNAFYHKEQLELTKQLSEHSARASAAEKFKEDQEAFIADLSHEIINPLYAILGLVDIINEAASAIKTFNSNTAGAVISNNEEREKNLLLLQSSLNNINECIQYAIQATRNVLRWQKIESGMQKPENFPFLPKAVALSVLNMFSPESQKKKIPLVCDCPEEIPPVKGDKALLQEILFNLVSNALKFTNSGSIVIKLAPISVQSGQITLQFNVSDTGKGMSQNEIGKLFTRFTQGQKYKRKSQDYSGTGLGLSICRRLAELLGGEIKASSVEGKGSTFSFTVVCEKLSEQEKLTFDKEEEKALPFSTEFRHSRILIADDNDISQKWLQRILEKRGYICFTANDGEQAIEQYKAKGCDLLLLDIEMPRKDGYSTAEIIRELEKTEGKKTTPIIFLSAHSEEELRKRTSQIEECNYFSKGSGNELLYSLIEKMLKNAMAESNKFKWQFDFSKAQASSEKVKDNPKNISP